MRKLNAPGDSVQDVFSTCIESYRDAALKNRLRSIVPVLSDEASRFEDCVLTSKYPYYSNGGQCRRGWLARLRCWTFMNPSL